jgi:hypothetical protein
MCACLQDMLPDVQGFCVEHGSIREASALFRNLKAME